MRALAILVALSLFIACVGDDPDTSSSSSGGSSTSGGPSARQVQCDDKRCATGEVCCLDFGDSSIDDAFCSPEAACTTGGFLACDGTSDCGAGEICCVQTRGGSVQYGPSYCAPQCRLDSDVQLCNGNGDCVTSKSCVPPQAATTPTGLMQCAK